MSNGKDLTSQETLKAQSHQRPVIVPLVDIYENDDEILLFADMPGVNKQDISVDIDNGKLSISGLRRYEKGGVMSWQEFGEVEFQRTFAVPQAIDVSRVQAGLNDGVLRLTLPKSEAAKPRQIEITNH